MQAVIMAAGKGVRMQPLTLSMPKPLLKITGKAIIDYTLAALPPEIDEVIVVIGYLGDQIKAHLAGYTDKKITFVELETLEGTGQAVTACKSLIRGNFLAFNGDDLYDQSDVEKLVGQDNAWLVQKQNPLPARFNSVSVDENGFLQDLESHDGTQSGYAVIGAYALTPEYFNWQLVKTKSGEFSLPHTVLAAVKTGTRVKIIEADHWFAIGFPEDLTLAEEYLKNAYIKNT